MPPSPGERPFPSTSHRCTAPSPERPALPGCSGCRPRRRTAPSGSAAPSPAAPFRVTRKAPGNGHSTGAWRVSAPSRPRCWPNRGSEATELGLEGSQGFAQMFTGGHLDPGALLDGLGDSWFITSRWIKRYPMNTTLHAPVEALLQVMREQRSAPQRHRRDRRRLAAGRALSGQAPGVDRRERTGKPALRPRRGGGPRNEWASTSSPRRPSPIRSSRS